MENDDAVAHGLLHAMKTYKFVATLYVLCDVLPILTTLSLVFQKENVSLTAILPSVNATIASLNLLRSQPGLHLQKIDEVLVDLTTQFGIIVTESDKKYFQEHVREKYVDALVDNLKIVFLMLELLMLLRPFWTLRKQHRCINHFQKLNLTTMVQMTLMQLVNASVCQRSQIHLRGSG